MVAAETVARMRGPAPNRWPMQQQQQQVRVYLDLPSFRLNPAMLVQWW